MKPQFAGTPTAILRDWRPALKRETVPVPCNGCVSCCRSGMLVTLTPAEAQRLPTQVGPDGKLKLAHRGRDCAMFDAQNNRCSIYEDRPEVCKTYDCRQLWMGGLRNTHRGREMNERLDSWRTEVHSDTDRGIVALMFTRTHELMGELDDTGAAAAAAAALCLLHKKEHLRAIGRQASVRENLPAVLRLLNEPQPLPDKEDL
jgi:hypothetical protein